jgi:DNA-binding IclR family transcriptional regulator
VLAWEDPSTVRRIYEAWRPVRRPQGPLASLSDYMRHLREIRRRGYLTGLASTPYPDVRICYTEAPIFNDEGEPAFVVSLTALTGSESPVHRFYPDEVLKVASKVMRGIGGRQPAVTEVDRPDGPRAEAQAGVPSYSRSRRQASRVRRSRSAA